MKPTKLSAIVSYAVASSIIGVFLAEFLVRSGAPIPVSPTSLVAVLPFTSIRPATRLEAVKVTPLGRSSPSV